MVRKVVVAGVVVCGLFGCGDDAVDDLDGGPDASVTLDAGSDAGVSCPSELVLVTVSDFTTARVAEVDMTDGTVEFGDSDLADQDTWPERAGCLPLLMERGTGTLQIQDPLDPTESVKSIDLNPPGSSGVYSANPQQVVSIGLRKAYLILQASNQVLVVDPTATPANAIRGTIDLSGFLDPDDVDGLVDQVGAIRIGDRVFVGMGNFWFDNSFAIQFEGSALAVIDTETDTLVDADPIEDGVQAIELEFENPWRGMVHDPARNRLLVAATGGSFGVIDGGIEAVDLTRLASDGGVLLETDLEAEIVRIVPAFDTRIGVIVGSELRGYELADLTTASTSVPASVLWQASTVDATQYGDGMVTWASDGLRLLSGFGQDITPGAAPIDLGNLPIYKVVSFP